MKKDPKAGNKPNPPYSSEADPLRALAQKIDSNPAMKRALLEAVKKSEARAKKARGKGN